MEKRGLEEARRRGERARRAGEARGRGGEARRRGEEARGAGEGRRRGEARTGQLAIEDTVEPVRGGAVDQEAKGGEAEEARVVEVLVLLDEELGEDVAEREADKGGERLHQQRLLLELLFVGLPHLPMEEESARACQGKAGHRGSRSPGGGALV